MNDKKNILVVEDEDVFQYIYKTNLEDEGFNVTILKDGTGVMDFLEKNPVDLVMLDLMMPEVDGFTIIRNIRANDKFKNLKIIVLSSLGQEEDQQEVLKQGVSAYIVKSKMTMEETIDTIKKTIQG